MRQLGNGNMSQVIESQSYLESNQSSKQDESGGDNA